MTTDDREPPRADRDTNASDVERGDERAREARPGTPFTQKLGRVVLVVVAVLFVAFALANAHPVEFSWIFGDTQVVERGGERVSGGVPLILLLGVAFAAGATVGGLAVWQRGRGRRKEAKRKAKES